MAATPQHPRLRDVPAPRPTKGMMAPLFRLVFAWPYRFALAGLHRAGILAWHLTLLAVAGNAIVGVLLLTGRRFMAGVVLLVAGLLDVFDGGMARLRGQASRAGAFLDSVMDRISDLVVFGCLFWSLAAQGNRLAAALALSSLLVALLVSAVRAEAEAMGLPMTEGLFQRLERYVALTVGLTVPATLIPILVALAALGAITVLQRSAASWRGLARQ